MIFKPAELHALWIISIDMQFDVDIRLYEYGHE